MKENLDKRITMGCGALLIRGHVRRLHLITQRSRTNDNNGSGDKKIRAVLWRKSSL